jgi:hypothetical protein
MRQGQALAQVLPLALQKYDRGAEEGTWGGDPETEFSGKFPGGRGYFLR